MHQNSASIEAGRSADDSHRVAVLALPDVVAFDLTIATQVFGHDGTDRYRLSVCGVRPGPVHTGYFELSVPHGLELLTAADTIVVPGFTRPAEPTSPVPPEVVRALREAADRGVRLASICTGAFALAEAGLLDGRRATTHWRDCDELTRRYPAVRVEPGVLYVDNGLILTSAGLAAGLDLCLHLYGLDHGEQAAIERARRLVTPLHRSGGQAQFIATEPGLDHGTMSSVTRWASAHLAEPIGVADLARQAGLAPRTFSRRFSAQVDRSPHAWLTQLRLAAACRMLEREELTVETVAARSGLGSAANLRLHFQRAYATTPTAYRSTFAGRSVAATHDRPAGTAAAELAHDDPIRSSGANSHKEMPEAK